ncbi:competence protein ComEC [Alteribacillus persepolensis]|uniref:Competence protein ComEC n=1 Tax=Alteribacillus persepolensis TaxID=568899 RepID=A0A1G8CNV5_9BACI|nr:DNA internalization-related competence protein ComEC/Rec2 [Alteribacillus persepolensis]SDH46983.1 competence protein ComEC [Alteribacillus persepolensis]
MYKHSLTWLLGPLASTSLAISDFSSGSMLFLCMVVLYYFCFVRHRQTAIFVTLISILLFVRTEMVIMSNETMLTGGESVVTGTVVDGPLRDGSQADMTMRLSHGESLLVRISLEERTDVEKLQTLSPAAFCHVNGQLTSPHPSSNFYAFDYSHYLNTQGIHWILETSLRDLSCRTGSSWYPSDIIKKWRHAGIQKIQTAFNHELQGIAAALIFGERHLLDTTVEEAYQQLGLIHLLAVSGLHVGLISGSLYYLLLRCGVTKETAENILLIILPVYIILAGAAPSVVRAASMVMLYILLKKWKKHHYALDVLVFFALCLLFYSPYYLVHVGFQLSFIVSAALLLSGQVIQKTPRVLISLTITGIAQIAALPIILYHFYEFSLLSLVFNFFFIPFISFVVLPSVFILYFSFLLLPEVAEVLSIPLSLIVEHTHSLLLAAAQWKAFQLILGKPSIFISAGLAFSALWLFYRFDRYRYHKKAVLPGVLWMAVLGVQWIEPFFDKYGYVTFLDVGQGDSIVIELPFRQAVYVIDTGGAISYEQEAWEERKVPYNPGKSVVVPYLKAKGISTIDKLIITHGHVDHYGGVLAVADNIVVRQVMYGHGRAFSEEEQELLSNIHHQNIPIQFVKQGDGWKERSAVFHVLSPKGTEESGNHRSIVLKAAFGGVTWLFTGDLEKEGEHTLLETFPSLKADMIKIAHHGSSTSTTEPFISQVQPKMAFITAGRCNHFGHPHTETINTLQAHRIKTFRTDTQGAIKVTFDNHAPVHLEHKRSANDAPIDECK